MMTSSLPQSRLVFTLGFVMTLATIYYGASGIWPMHFPIVAAQRLIETEAARTASTTLSSASETKTAPIAAGLTEADWTSIKQEYERHRQAFFQFRAGNIVQWQARNHAQQWLAQFDGRGFEVKPEDAQWRWGLELHSYGFPGNERAVRGSAQAQASVERLTYDWDETLQEWYLNDQRGLEHGYTLRERPAGSGEHLILRLGVRGKLRAQVQNDGRGVSFVNDQGGEVLNYTGLKAYDANGRELTARMEAAAGELRLTVEESGAHYPITIDPIAQQAYLKASNTEASDAFGFSVAISGDTAVVGARFEDSNATGINGNQSDNSASAAGAAYVFVRNGAGWGQQAYLKASNAEVGDEFGYAVSISGDTIVVGAPLEDSNATGVNGNQNDNSTPDSGAAYVFVRSGGVWTQQAYLKSSNPDIADLFGWSAAISGETVVVGAWLEASNATGVNGNQNDNSAAVSGAAYVFTRSGSAWSQQAYLKASNTDVSDSFGFSVAISGDTIAIGAPFESSNATGVNGNQSNNTGGSSGAAYVFVRSGGVWTQQAYLKASNTDAGDLFGYAISISGNSVLVGAPLESSNTTSINGNQNDNSAAVSGAAYVFTRSGNAWSQQAYLKASNTDTADLFAWSVGISGDAIVVGAQGESSNATGVNGNQFNNTAVFSGAAYIFVRQAGIWRQQAYLKASNTMGGDVLGSAVAISGDTVIVGAPSESSNATGVNGNQSDNSAAASGAAYIFFIPPPDLFLTKTDNGAIFPPAGSGSYILTVSNVATGGPTIGPITVTDNLPGNLTLASFSGTGWSCTGTSNISCTHNGPVDGGACLPALTFIVNVGAGTPTGIDSITNTATVATVGEVNTLNNSTSETTSVLGIPKLTTNLADPLVCNGPGGLASVTATLTNPNQTALPANFTAILPVQLLALAGTCNASINPGGCAIAANGSTVTWNGTLNAGQTVTISYQGQIDANVAQGTQLCVNSVGTVAGVGANVQACLTVNCPAAGLLPLANAGTSDQKPGSLLVFPYYISKVAERKDTRLTISNAGAQLSYVHVFFMDGASCNQADLFVCLTPKAIFSFKASDYDPENTGFVLAVAVDIQGRPIANNGLIGNAFVDEGDYHGNYGAEAFWRYDTALTNISGGFAVLGLNGTQYDAAPIQFTVEIQSPLDAVGQRLVLAPLSGDLSGGLANLGNTFPALTNAAAQIGTGLAANEQEKTVSFSSLLNGGCLKSATISTNFPRVPGGLASLIPTGKMGLLSFRVGAGVGLLMTPRTSTNRWGGIRTLHKTAVGNVAIAIPVFSPVC
jgi:hypothetical protein